MNIILKVWHRFWRGYNQVLLESCLDEKVSLELQNKVAYHEMKLSA